MFCKLSVLAVIQCWSILSEFIAQNMLEFKECLADALSDDLVLDSSVRSESSRNWTWWSLYVSLNLRYSVILIFLYLCLTLLKKLIDFCLLLWILLYNFCSHVFVHKLFKWAVVFRQKKLRHPEYLLLYSFIIQSLQSKSSISMTLCSLTFSADFKNAWNLSFYWLSIKEIKILPLVKEGKLNLD